MIKTYVADLEQLKEELLEFDEKRQTNQLPPLDKDGNLIVDPSESKNGEGGAKMTLIERIAKALEPKGIEYRLKSLSQHTLSIYPVNTSSQHTHFTHLLKSLSRSTLSTHPLSPPYQSTLSTHPHSIPTSHTFSAHNINPPYQPTLSTHPINLPSQPTLSTHPTNPTTQPSLSIHHPLTTTSSPGAGRLVQSADEVAAANARAVNAWM